MVSPGQNQGVCRAAILSGGCRGEFVSSLTQVAGRNLFLEGLGPKSSFPCRLSADGFLQATVPFGLWPPSSSKAATAIIPSHASPL